ncbi:hypothetical protein SNE40_013005 [Patella caerulea]|uniref:Uncharacterized protein n=1 Tax=Patella caerulea TaxID=87958 RepID=A0AAN8JK26_PATCE
MNLRKTDLPPPDAMPIRIKPKGLDNKRQWYLYDEIRQFVKEELQDIVTPLHFQPKNPQATPSSDTEIEEHLPVSKRARN